jgi:aspartate/methionine/tyrosine aminotransferase
VAEITRFLAEPENHKYQGVSGIPTLQEAIAQKLAAENCIDVGDAHDNRLMATAGGNQAFLNVVLGILDPGEEVILPVPYYLAIIIANARPVLVPTDSN